MYNTHIPNFSNHPPIPNHPRHSIRSHAHADDVADGEGGEDAYCLHAQEGFAHGVHGMCGLLCCGEREWGGR